MQLQFILLRHFLLHFSDKSEQILYDTLENVNILNNFGSNLNLPVNKTRFREVPNTELKNILFWNDAYGVRKYDVGDGQEHFYSNLCPDTRCFTTSNRNYLKSVEDFDAIIIHQRGIGIFEKVEYPQKNPKNMKKS